MRFPSMCDTCIEAMLIRRAKLGNIGVQRMAGHEAPLSDMLEDAAQIAEAHFRITFGTDRIDAIRRAAAILRQTPGEL